MRASRGMGAINPKKCCSKVLPRPTTNPCKTSKSGSGVKKGYHKMPDGSMMKGAKHKGKR